MYAPHFAFYYAFSKICNPYYDVNISLEQTFDTHLIYTIDIHFYEATYLYELVIAIHAFA